MVNAKLVIVGGDAKQAEVQLKKLPTTIGRGRDATITLPHSLVSRQHCEIFEEQGQLYVKDLNSLNGTYLNNQKIVGTQTLLPDQLLTLGNVTFRAVYKIGDIDNHWDDHAFPSGENSITEDLFHGDTVDVDFEMMRRKEVRNATSKDDLSIESDTDHGPTPSIGRKSQFRSPPGKAQEVDSPIHIADEDVPAKDPSICEAAMETLPKKPAPASFTGMIDVPAESAPASSVQIDLGSESAPQQEASPSALNAFLKKMPK